MKKALLVGINTYSIPGNDLMGCVNDVHNMQDLLTSLFAFPEENITVITDRSATTANILKGLQALVSGAEPGDTLVFHYSGHGSQVPDDSDHDEADRLDECICPYDFNWEDKAIRDDDLGSIFGSLDPKVHIEFVLDCCHSGTGMKAAERHYRKPRFIPMPEGMAPNPERVVCRRAIKVKRAQVLWAACTARQYAADAYLDGKYCGAHTAMLCSLVRKAGGAVKRCDLLTSLRKALKENHFSQSPQLETSAQFKKAGFLS